MKFPSFLKQHGELQIRKVMPKQSKDSSLSLEKHITDTVKNLQDDTGFSDVSCRICFEDIYTGEGAVILDCCHIFCKACTVGYITRKIQDFISDISCPSCDKIITHSLLQELLPKEQFDIWLTIALKHHLGNNRSIYFHCPTADCPFIMEKLLFDVVKCPLCKKSTCSLCYGDHEEMIQCEKYKEWKTLNNEVEDRFNALVEQRYLVKCPNCLKYVEKNGGCSQVMCICKVAFTWTGK
jgi:hypothetical protein